MAHCAPAHVLDRRLHVHHRDPGRAAYDLAGDAAHGSMRGAESARARMVYATADDQSHTVWRFDAMTCNYLLNGSYQHEAG